MNPNPSFSSISSFSKQRMEPIVPIFLGIHGNFMLLNKQSTDIIQFTLVNVILLIGVISIFFKKMENRYMLTKFLFFTFTGLVLIYLDGGVGSFFTIWLFLLAPYALYLNDTEALCVIFLIPLLYGLLYPFSTIKLDLFVVLQRIVVLVFIGLFVVILNRNLVTIAVEKESEIKRRQDEHVKRLLEKEMKLKLEKVNTQLKRSNSDLEKFAFIASHDLKAPLNKILLNLQLINDKNYDKLDSETKNLISSILNSTSQMNNLITDLLNYSQTNETEKTMSSVNTSEIMQKIINNLTTLIEQKHAKIKYNNLPIIKGNESLITSLFQNLVQNGIKFNNSIKPEVIIHYERDEHSSIIFSIHDNGIGIKQENKEKIFDMFQRFESSNIYPGSGIGLALCKKIVEIHEGQIWVESNINEGSTFFVKLPQV